MTKRLLLGYLTITVIVLLLLEIPLALFYSQRELERFTSGVEHDASAIASIYEDDLEAGRDPDPQPAVLYESRTGARVVVVNSAGISLIDTEQVVPRDFSTRPEIAKALKGQRASGQRTSNTLGTDLVYVAIPVTSSGVVHGALRLTVSTDDVNSHIHRFWLGLVATGAGVMAVMAGVGWVIARSVTEPARRLERDATRFATGDLTIVEEANTGPPELRALSTTMSKMAVRLAALMDEQRAFVADASHQLRTPLTALRLRLENLQTHLVETDAAELEIAIGETERLATLVNDLLQLARADQVQQTAVFDLALLTAQRVDTWSAVADSHDVRLRLVGTDGAATVSATPGAIEQILDNTLDNALNASPAGGEIVLMIRRGDVFHQLTVSDQGPGLSDEDKARATHRFWRKTSAAPGTGLGLAIVEALARGSGGTITLADAPDHGLAVTVSLPAVPALTSHRSGSGL